MNVQVFEESDYKNQLATVNVVEVVDGDIVSIRSFPDNSLGNSNAEDLFKKLILEDDEEALEEDIASAIEDGVWSHGTWTCNIVHSF